MFCFLIFFYSLYIFLIIFNYCFNVHYFWIFVHQLWPLEYYFCISNCLVDTPSDFHADLSKWVQTWHFFSKLTASPRLPNSVDDSLWPSVLIFYCCSNKLPQTSGLKQHRFILLHSGGRESDISSTRLKSGVSKAASSAGAGENSFQWRLHSLAVASSSSFRALRLPSLLLPSHCMVFCPDFSCILWQQLLWFSQGHLNNPGCSPHLKMLNFITAANPFCNVKLTLTVPEIRTTAYLGGRKHYSAYHSILT